MNHDPAERLRSLLGRDAVEQKATGIPYVTPDSAEGIAVACRVAAEEGWTVRVEGNGTWLPPDADADFAVSTRALNRTVDISPADLMATVQAGTSLESLRRQAAALGMWLPLDPPGRPDRTIGSIVATGTAAGSRPEDGS